MKKKLFVVLVVTLALGLLSIQAFAGPPEIAVGEWIYAPTSQDPPEVVGCNTVIAMIDAGTFTGTFDGDETEEGILVLHCNGKGSFKGNLSFVGTVDGSALGTMEMRIVGKSDNPLDPPAVAYWQGTWVILSGTDGLENLRGQGTWEGGPGDLVYEGKYHLEPN